MKPEKVAETLRLLEALGVDVSLAQPHGDQAAFRKAVKGACEKRLLDLVAELLRVINAGDPKKAETVGFKILERGRRIVNLAATLGAKPSEQPFKRAMKDGTAMLAELKEKGWQVDKISS
jgi:hypothetical protein